MASFKGNIETLTRRNTSYREILATTPEMQLVIMSVPESIPRERHSGSQFIRIESGRGVITVGSRTYRMRDGDSIVIPARAWHEVRNTGRDPLKLYAIYSPPEHHEH